LFGWVTCFCGVLSEISLICVLYLKTLLFLKPCLCTELPCIDLDSYVCVNDASSVLVASGVLWFLEKSGKQQERYYIDVFSKGCGTTTLYGNLGLNILAAADVLLWRKKHLSIGLLVGATLAWILLEKTGYTVLSIVSNVTLFLVVILFVWSNVAALLNRSFSQH